MCEQIFVRQGAGVVQGTRVVFTKSNTATVKEGFKKSCL